MRPYREEDPTQPRTVYGTSKRAGEKAVLEADRKALVVRTSWVFGPGRNFVVAILDQAARRRRGEAEGPLKVVDDQRGTPTAAADLAEALLELCRRMGADDPEAAGLLHLRNGGETTWYGFARKALELAGYDEIEVEPVPTSAFPTPAPRPAYSVLSCERARRLGIELRSWAEALAGYLSGPDRPGSVLPEAQQGAPASRPSEPARRDPRPREVQG
jgi:dTDP-4-dehydrorhamnose reductase